MAIRAPENSLAAQGYGASWNNYLNQQDPIIGTGLGIGGDSGVGILYNPIGIDDFGSGGNAPGGGSTGGSTGYIPIVETPNLPNSNQQYVIRIGARLRPTSDNKARFTQNGIGKTFLLVNGQNVAKELDTTLNITIQELVNEGEKTITIENQEYFSNEKYVIDLVNNPLFTGQISTNNDIRPDIITNSSPTSTDQLPYLGTNIVVNPFESLISYSNRRFYTEESYIRTNQRHM